MSDRAFLCQAEHWVIKVGSNVLLGPNWFMDRPTFASLVHQVDCLLRVGVRVTLVSSGAVALGRQILGDHEMGHPRDIPKLQALAALGQLRLMHLYEDEFGYYNRHVGQVLFSRGDLDDRQRYLNARSALEAMHELGAVPIINENDTVATDELKFGDNDQLAAMTCGVAQADVLVILSDVDGVYEVDDTLGTRVFTDRIRCIEAEDERLLELAGPSTSGVGTGGMVSKIKAARTAARMGVPTVIASGKQAGVLEALYRGQDLGTLLTVCTDAEEGSTLGGRKVWLGAGALAVGKLMCDAGAVDAVCARHASLLPSGLLSVVGDFFEGAVVELCDAQGVVFAQGVSVYSAQDLEKIKGLRSEQIEEVLGYKVMDVVVHRDALIVW